MPSVFYHDDDEAGSAVRTWKTADDSAPFTEVSALVDQGECTVYAPPTFRLIVRELWPDDGPAYDENDPDCVDSGGGRSGSDADIILDLFGLDALRWWCALSEDQRKARTAARGLRWLVDPTDNVARDERRAALTVKVSCDYDITEASHYLWCRWQPSRSGFYSLHVGGAWLTKRIGKGVRDISELVPYLNDPDEGQERRQRLLEELDEINALHPPLNRTPADLGLLLVDVNQDAAELAIDLDWTYSAAAASTAGCPPVDLRISCTTENEGNYTETEPIGVIVHEARVVTRPPSGP